MLRNQDITVPYGDSRQVVWDIEDILGGTSDGPTNLLGKGIRWDLYQDNRASMPALSLVDDNETLVISGAESGEVTLYLDAEHTTLNISSGRYYLRITEGEHTWTVATGKYTITR